MPLFSPEVRALLNPFPKKPHLVFQVVNMQLANIL
jgi:hypothetical protein